MATPNKGYATQATGDNPGTWGEILNDDVFDIIDKNIGGILNLALSASNVTLTTAQSRNAIIRLTGTLLANITITTECLGFFFVENETTGNFTVTVRNNIVATAVAVDRNTRQIIISDAVNGCRISSKSFETGVKMSFYMATAPIGWTRDITANLNNSALRLVTTGGGSTGGSVDFTTAFSANRITIGQANLPNITLTAQSAGDHSHTTNVRQGNQYSGSGSGSGPYSAGTGTIVGLPSSTNGAHTHNVPLGGSGTPISLEVKYADFLIATKD